MRRYLLNGGFLMVDDFWGHEEWLSIYEQMNDRESAISQWQRYVDVGKVVGERDDMLQRAQDRLDRLKDGTAKMPKKAQKQARINQEDSNN